jgi:hypothetical protein
MYIKYIFYSGECFGIEVVPIHWFSVWLQFFTTCHLARKYQVATDIPEEEMFLNVEEI